ncbi:MAG: hypothetical protein AAGI51_08270 [Pseudomonadota bacterium]
MVEQIAVPEPTVPVAQARGVIEDGVAQVETAAQGPARLRWTSSHIPISERTPKQKPAMSMRIISPRSMAGPLT